MTCTSEKCPSPTKQVSKKCRAGKPCEKDKPEWGPWGPKSECTTTCGDFGVQLRERKCLRDKCDGADKQYLQCNPGPCAAWADWDEWSGCTRSCDGGSRTRTRRCVGIGQCEGNGQESEACNTLACNAWGEWGEFGKCQYTCGGGEKFRTRPCARGDCTRLG